jgi:hypothetical protein
MTFSSNAFLFVPVLATASNAVTSATYSPVDLGEAENYVILAKSSISIPSLPALRGASASHPLPQQAWPASASIWTQRESMRHFRISLARYASNYGGTTPADLTTAVSNMETAYTDAAGRAIPSAARINVNEGAIGVLDVLNDGSLQNPWTPGVYTFGSDVSIPNTTYFNGQNDRNSVFSIQIAGNLRQAAGVSVELTNGVLAKYIFWQISGVAGVGGGAHIMQGIILVFTDVLFETGSSLSGRVLP